MQRIFLMLFNGSSQKKKHRVPKRPKSILIIKLSSIGDVVHTLPLLEVLRNNYPEARIDWLVEEDARSIIEGHPNINRVIVSGRKLWLKRFLKIKGKSRITDEVNKFVKDLRSIEYDLVLDIQGLFKSGILTFLSKGKRKIGLSGSRECASIFLTEQPCRVNLHQHAIDRYLTIAEHLKCPNRIWKGEIPIQPAAKKKVDEFLHGRDIQTNGLIAINPMARWATKLWEPERFAHLAERIKKELSCDIVFTGGFDDRSIIQGIIDNMNENVLNMAGKTNLKELAYLYSNCDLLISTDSGPMHIAAAMGCSTIALFGPTAPWRTGPYGKGHVIIRDEIACSPCFKKKCNHRTCMINISVDRVFDTVTKAMKERTH